MGNSRSRVRRPLTAGLSVASAGIVTLGLVIVPPDDHGVRTQVRPVQLTSVALSPLTYLGGLEKLINSRVPSAPPVAPEVRASAAELASASGTASPTFDSAISGPQANSAAVAVNPVSLVITAVLTQLTAIFGPSVVGPFVLFGSIAFAALVVFPVLYVVETAYEAVASILRPFISLPLTLPLPGTVGALDLAKAAPASTLMSEAPVTDPGPTTPKDGDVSKSGKSIEATMTKTGGTETVEAGESKTVVQTLAMGADDTRNATEPSSTSEPTKPKLRPTTHRTVVRESSNASEQQPDRPHRAKGDHTRSKTATAADKGAESESSSATGDSPNSK